MRCVVQRSGPARVEIDGRLSGQIDGGLVVLAAFAASDTEKEMAWMVNKLLGLRIFCDDEGKMNLALRDVGGGVLLVSQFTLYGDVRKGRRPSFTKAAAPEEAERLYEAVVAGLRARGLTVATGRFRAMMNVRADVWGPVTILIDSEKTF